MGILITIDGLDGSGKQTQSERLVQRLNENGITAKIVSFPDYESDSSALVKMYLGGRFSSDPEKVNAYAASSFFAVDRYASYMLNFKKDYDNGTVIICNRYTTSNAIHQLSKIDDEKKREEFIEWLYDFEFNKLAIPAPDMTILLSVPVEISLGLIKSRSESTGREIDIHENAEHLKKAYKAAHFAAEHLGWTAIECTKDGSLLSIDEISEKVYLQVVNFLDKKTRK